MRYLCQPTIDLLDTKFSVAQWLKHPTSVRNDTEGRGYNSHLELKIVICVILSTHIISFIIIKENILIITLKIFKKSKRNNKKNKCIRTFFTSRSGSVPGPICLTHSELATLKRVTAGTMVQTLVWVFTTR